MDSGYRGEDTGRFADPSAWHFRELGRASDGRVRSDGFAGRGVPYQFNKSYALTEAARLLRAGGRDVPAEAATAFRPQRDFVVDDAGLYLVKKGPLRR
jgi:hypothetical protein